MTSVTGSFSGTITRNHALTLSDLPNHQMSIGEVKGIQNSPDPLWQGSNLTYWGITELLDGEGTQRGYYNNIHGDTGRDWGTFEGKVTIAGGTLTVEGTWKCTGGDGDYRGISASGNFKTVAKSETEIDATWDGTYELAKAQAG
jgi:hypothetical protein